MIIRLKIKYDQFKHYLFYLYTVSFRENTILYIVNKTKEHFSNFKNSLAWKNISNSISHSITVEKINKEKKVSEHQYRSGILKINIYVSSKTLVKYLSTCKNSSANNFKITPSAINIKYFRLREERRKHYVTKMYNSIKSKIKNICYIYL